MDIITYAGWMCTRRRSPSQLPRAAAAARSAKSGFSRAVLGFSRKGGGGAPEQSGASPKLLCAACPTSRSDTGGAAKRSGCPRRQGSGPQSTTPVPRMRAKDASRGFVKTDGFHDCREMHISLGPRGGETRPQMVVRLTGNEGFESIFLQRRVSDEPLRMRLGRNLSHRPTLKTIAAVARNRQFRPALSSGDSR